MKSFAEDETVRRKFIDAAMKRSMLPETTIEREASWFLSSYIL